jgi:predicted DNA-binding transcriptional regulator YafY
MNRIDRLLGIVTFLQSRKFVPAEKIADKFEISIRTVYRDIKALSELGIPVSFENPKGYFLVQGYFLPPVSFTNEEANALLLTEALVYGFADHSTQKHYSSALNKVKVVLRSTQKDGLEILSDAIRIQKPSCYDLHLEHLSVLQNAITTKKIVELDYKNLEQQVSNRKVEPIGLVFYAFNWHLIAYCHTRQEYRDFKVSRILSARQTDLPFTLARHIQLNDYMKLLPVDY